MTKIKNEYIVGLDIGTNSCGWVAMDFQNTILRMHGKTAIGSHLFDAGNSAADRDALRNAVNTGEIGRASCRERV